MAFLLVDGLRWRMGYVDRGMIQKLHGKAHFVRLSGHVRVRVTSKT